MFKIVILSFALILLATVQTAPQSGDNDELKIEFQNETYLEKPIYRNAPVFLRDKVYAVHAFVKVCELYSMRIK